MKQIRKNISDKIPQKIQIPNHMRYSGICVQRKRFCQYLNVSVM